jgi:ABC-2 type transport system ATP-binding protein/ribosome-dependent ATPase
MHVAAKRYLCAVEPAYLNQLSEASLLSLRVQGGPMTPSEIEAFEASPHAQDAVRLRRYDDIGKVPGLETPPLEHYRPVLQLALSARAPQPRSHVTDTNSAGTVLAETSHVTRHFGAFTAVDDVSMSVATGEIVGLIGANGAGKTTLIRMLLGLLPASEGSVALFGQTPSRTTRQQLGYVPQSLGLYTDLTVTENLRFTARAFGSTPPRTLGDELSEVRERLVGDIGLGLQRQLAFVAALSHNPSLLVLDEPTSGVDPLARSRLWDTIHDQADRGVGILVTTHYMQEADQCDRLVIMVAGSVAAAGTVSDIIGGRTAVQVDTNSWEQAFTALTNARLQVLLAGRSVRVTDTSAAEVEQVLDTAGLSTRITTVPSTLDETLITLSRTAAATTAS